MITLGKGRATSYRWVCVANTSAGEMLGRALTADGRSVLALVAELGMVRRKDLVARLGLSVWTASRVLGRLMGSQEVTTVGTLHDSSGCSQGNIPMMAGTRRRASVIFYAAERAITLEIQDSPTWRWQDPLGTVLRASSTIRTKSTRGKFSSRPVGQISAQQRELSGA